MRWLDRIPLFPLLAGAILLGLAPFRPQPHLWEKLHMLVMGELIRPLDMFDLALHGVLPVLLALKIVSYFQHTKTNTPR